MRRFDRDDRGQALVLVGAALMVLLGGLALSVDWGYALTARRSLQNAADAAAMAVGRTLATSTVVIGGQLRFMATDAQLWTRAFSIADANYGLASAVTITLEYGNATPTWTASGGAASATEVPSGTVYVRVTAKTTYRTFFGAATGRAQLDAAASARVRLSGGAIPMGPVIGLARHINAGKAAATGMFSTTCTSPCTNARNADPIQLWPTADFKNFQDTALDLSRKSHTVPAQPDALIAAWDRSGSTVASPPTTPKIDRTGKCTGGTWNTNGNEDNSKENHECSVPNWDYYGFQGTLSLTSSYAAVTSPREAPAAYSTSSKVLCSPTDAQWQATYGYRLERAACDQGDWVETVKKSVHKRDVLAARVAAQGGTGLVSDRIISGGPNNNKTYGNALTVLVVLWDCGEVFQANPDRWDMATNSGTFPNPPANADCTTLPSGSADEVPERVHVFAVAPFTIYERLIDNNSVSGFWGGMFVTPPADAPRPLWVFANTAYLVPDE